MYISTYSKMDIIKELPYTEPLDNQFISELPYKKYPLRRAKIILFSGVMRNYKPFREISYKLQKFLTVNIETGCFNHSIEKVTGKNIIPTWQSSTLINIYNAICYRVAESLDCQSKLNSDYLIKLIIKDPSEAESVSYKIAKDLCPDNNSEIYQRIKSRLQQKVQIKTTSMYKCEKCGKNEVIMVRKQLRSQDEGASTICVCIYCNHGWTLL